MPTHARPDVLGLAIDSVLDQSLGDFELLLVGDGVDDATRDVVARYTDPRIRWFDLPKAPHFGYANRNVALARSRGSLIAFAADDDLMFPDHLERLAAVFSHPEVMLAHSLAVWVSADGIVAPDLTNLEIPAEMKVFLEVGNTLAAGTVMYRADAMPERNAWPEDVSISGDWHLWRRIIGAQSPAACRHLPLVTMMHFKAARKARRDSHFARLAAFLDLADEADWWPSALRRPAAPDQTPQSVYAQHRFADPDGFARDMRAACDLVIRHMVLHLLDTYAAPASDWRLKALDDELTSLRQANAALEAECNGLRGEREAFVASTSWRLTAPVRALGRLIARRD